MTTLAAASTGMSSKGSWRLPAGRTGRPESRQDAAAVGFDSILRQKQKEIEELKFSGMRNTGSDPGISADASSTGQDEGSRNKSRIKRGQRHTCTDG